MTSADSQVSMALPPVDTDIPEKTWLGLITDHRRLFGALQDGWLHPLPSDTGIMLGIERYAEGRESVQDGHPIEVHLKLSPEKLPGLEVAAFCNGDWRKRSIREIESSDTALYWPGACPTFAIHEITVSSEEEWARLTGIAQLASNLTLPEDLVRVVPETVNAVSSDTQPQMTATKLVIPKNEDAVHGAITMAVWAVPRIDPWLDLLTTSLARERALLPKLADDVDAPWWRFPPWVPLPKETWQTDFQDCLWKATVDTFLNLHVECRISSREVVERIAGAVRRHGGSNYMASVSEWSKATNSILRGESIIRLDDWKSLPVWVAIQLVLTRPDPLRFKTWFQELPDLPPAIAWSAATLCGLLHGYKRLDAHFRGDAFQRELVSVLALRACSDEARAIDWPSLASEEPTWRRDCGSFVLSWGASDFARRPEKARGKWYTANFGDPKVAQDARTVATELNWSCANREIVLKNTRLPLRGSGSLNTLEESGPELEVKGEVRLPVSQGVTIEEAFDTELFRHLVAVEGGRFPNPPTSQVDDAQIIELKVPGLAYVRGFLTEVEEEKLVATIDRSEWRSDIKRRVQHYGWLYDYKARKVDPSMYLGPLPEWANRLGHRLVAEGLVHQLPDQVIVNEYIENQGIHRHSDADSFADGIATISLLESWEMVFRENGTKRKVGQVLERRSVAVMSGDARYRWTHEIPKRKTAHGRVKRGRRISLTFRKVIVPPDMELESGVPSSLEQIAQGSRSGIGRGQRSP